MLTSFSFANCPVLETVKFTGKIEIFDTSCFEQCPSLKNITLPSTLKEIGMYCFQYDTGLTEITFPNGLETLRYKSFFECNNLKQVVFPSSVIEVHEDAFLKCDNVKTKYPSYCELKEDGYYRKTETITIIGTYDYGRAYQVFEIVNRERKNNGLSELKYDADVTNVAMRRAAELSVYFSHTRPDGSSCFTQLNKLKPNLGLNRRKYCVRTKQS